MLPLITLIQYFLYACLALFLGISLFFIQFQHAYNEDEDDLLEHTKSMISMSQLFPQRTFTRYPSDEQGKVGMSEDFLVGAKLNTSELFPQRSLIRNNASNCNESSRRSYCRQNLPKFKKDFGFVNVEEVQRNICSQQRPY